MPEAPETLATLGRILVAALFVIGGIRHFRILPEMTALLALRRIPAPRAAIIAASLFEIACGLALALGVAPAAAATGLALFTLAATAVAIGSSPAAGPERAAAINLCLSNAAILGGLLLCISAA